MRLLTNLGGGGNVIRSRNGVIAGTAIPSRRVLGIKRCV